MTIIYNFYRTWPHSGDRDEDEDKDKDEDKDVIPNYVVVLTTLFKRFGICRKRDFWCSVVTSVMFCSNPGIFDKNKKKIKKKSKNNNKKILKKKKKKK